MAILTPVFGYNPNQGFGNFNTVVYIERISSGTTSATTLGSYSVSSNPTTYPGTQMTHYYYLITILTNLLTYINVQELQVLQQYSLKNVIFI